MHNLKIKKSKKKGLKMHKYIECIKKAYNKKMHKNRMYKKCIKQKMHKMHNFKTKESPSK